MTQKQIRRRSKEIRRRWNVLVAKREKLNLQISHLNDEDANLRKQCAHSNRTALKSPPPPYLNGKRAEVCVDCREVFFYE